MLICGLTPYNDYALNNTFLVGNNLPLGVVMLLFALAVLVNAPLSRWAPRRALSSGELTVAFAMMLVACTLPSSGLMRYFPASLVAPFWYAAGDPNLLSLLEQMNLPPWLFPTFEGAGPRQWVNDPLVATFFERWPADQRPPYLAWLVPALSWGVFLFALYGALLCMTAIVRHQWADNERLAFPLAQIQIALVEQPRPGRFFNDMFSRRSFWVAFGGVFFIHAINGLHNYVPDVPQIPVWYNLTDILTEPPFTYLDFKLKDAAIFFTVVGVTFFVPSYVSFSLWFFFILFQGRLIYHGMTSGDPWPLSLRDEHFGAVLALAATILWVGRRHWWMVIRQGLRGRRDGEPAGRYLPYPLAFWGLLLCCAAMVGWLMLAGAVFIGALVVVLLLMIGFLVIARIIAETGLIHGQLYVPLNKPFTLIEAYSPSLPVPLKTFYLGQMVQASHFDYREPLPVYAAHAMRVSDQTIFDSRPMDQDTPDSRRTGRRIMLLMLLALLVGYGVSFYSMLRVEYSYAYTLDDQARRINDWGSEYSPRFHITNPTQGYVREGGQYPYDPLGAIIIGFGITIALSVLRLYVAWWPLHPVGYVLLGTFPSSHLWFSIFWGWLAKVLILRFGGAGLYQNAKPFFLGLIAGEAIAAGLWLVLGLVFSAAGLPYEPVRIMPG